MDNTSAITPVDDSSLIDYIATIADNTTHISRQVDNMQATQTWGVMVLCAIGGVILTVYLCRWVYHTFIF